MFDRCRFCHRHYLVTPWHVVEYVVIEGSTHGVLTCCEDCWSRLPLQERLNLTDRVMRLWKQSPGCYELNKHILIDRAVINEFGRKT